MDVAHCARGQTRRITATALASSHAPVLRSTVNCVQFAQTQTDHSNQPAVAAVDEIIMYIPVQHCSITTMKDNLSVALYSVSRATRAPRLGCILLRNPVLGYSPDV